ncbi:MAG: hypothetical protein PUC11_07010 [Elusimicrobia bacterium]|nr:hypothetical protein [Elusimicrobiota bacterium]
MNNSAKIDLENGIFFRAARLNVRIDACRGELFCAAPDVRLQVMLCVYNAFFLEENRRLCAEEAPEWLNWWKSYKKQTAACGGRLPGAVYRPDLRVELSWVLLKK